MSGCRVKRIQRYIGNEPFMLMYGDRVYSGMTHEMLDYIAVKHYTFIMKHIRYTREQDEWKK